MSIEKRDIIFPTTFMGSLPRNKNVIRKRRLFEAGIIGFEEYTKEAELQTRDVIKFQEDIGLDIITSGEIFRDNYVSFVSQKIGGVKEMSQMEMLDYIEDKKEFEKQLTILDVPASSIKNAICTGKLIYKGDIVYSELSMMKKYTNKPVKITIPGPYLLTRSMWLYDISKNGYKSKEELGEAVISIYEKELTKIQNLGVDVIQFDEPVLTEVVFTEGKPRSFMCASLSQKKDPKEELEFAAYLISNVMKHVDSSKSTSSLHVCRGNWSKNEEILLEGPYTPLIDLFSKINCDNLSLEFSTPRAGELRTLLEDTRIREKVSIGLGVINPRIDTIENVSDIVRRVNEALEYLDPQQIWLNPDCGFATFSNRPVNTYEIIREKGKNMVEAARILRNEYYGK